MSVLLFDNIVFVRDVWGILVFFGYLNKKKIKIM